MGLFSRRRRLPQGSQYTALDRFFSDFGVNHPMEDQGVGYLHVLQRIKFISVLKEAWKDLIATEKLIQLPGGLLF